MEGENFPYFFEPSSLSLTASLDDSPASNALDQSVQNYQFPDSSNQIDLASLWSAGSLELNPISTAAANTREIEKVSKKKARFGKRKKCIPPRVAFHTRSAEDILDDGYKWRKYGQKSVKNSVHPRSYYRCTHHTCNVKKQIQRHSKDTSVVVTTYEGIHNHPCEKVMETLGPILKQLQFLSRF